MYTFEERMEAVELYIQSGYSENIVSLSVRWGTLPIQCLGIGIMTISLRAVCSCQFTKASLYRSIKGCGY